MIVVKLIMEKILHISCSVIVLCITLLGKLMIQIILLLYVTNGMCKSTEKSKIDVGYSV